MADQTPTPGSTAATEGPQYAAWGGRALGFFLDFLPVLVLTTIAQVFFYSSIVKVDKNWAGGPTYQVFETRGPGVMFFLLYLIAIVYWFWNKGYLEGKTGKSLAKRLQGHSTLNETSQQPIGVGYGMLRAALVYIELILIGLCGLGLILWLWPIWDPKRQALLSDRTTGAIVVRD